MLTWSRGRWVDDVERRRRRALGQRGAVGHRGDLGGDRVAWIAWVLPLTKVPMANVTDAWLAGIVTLVGRVTGLPAGAVRSTTIGGSPTGLRVRVAVVATGPADSLTVVASSDR